MSGQDSASANRLTGSGISIGRRADVVAAGRPEEVVDRVDFTRDRNVADRPTDRPTDSGGPGRAITGTDRPTPGGRARHRPWSGRSLVELGRRSSAPPHDDPDDDVIFAGVARPCTGDLGRPYRYRDSGGPGRGLAGRRPIDTVDRACAPQQSEICKAKRLEGLAANVCRKRNCDRADNDILSLSPRSQNEVVPRRNQHNAKLIRKLHIR